MQRIKNVWALTQQTAFVAVWDWKKFRTVYYKVGRGGEDWRPLEIGKPYVKQKSIEQIAKDLGKKYPKGNPPLPTILDEAEADREVARNTPRGKKHKRKVS
jgi:hypothetical protein